ncbi:hypothetical protein AgCh_017910 [Apium graveolens]
MKLMKKKKSVRIKKRFMKLTGLKLTSDSTQVNEEANLDVQPITTSDTSHVVDYSNPIQAEITNPDSKNLYADKQELTFKEKRKLLWGNNKPAPRRDSYATLKKIYSGSSHARKPGITSGLGRLGVDPSVVDALIPRKNANLREIGGNVMLEDLQKIISVQIIIHLGGENLIYFLESGRRLRWSTFLKNQLQLKQRGMRYRSTYIPKNIDETKYPADMPIGEAKFKGNYKGKEVKMLVDNGSTLNLISGKACSSLKLVLEMQLGIQIMLPNEEYSTAMRDARHSNEDGKCGIQHRVGNCHQLSVVVPQWMEQITESYAEDKEIEDLIIDVVDCHKLSVVVPQWMEQIAESYARDKEIEDLIIDDAINKLGPHQYYLQQGLLQYQGKLVIGGAETSSVHHVFHVSQLKKVMRQEYCEGSPSGASGFNTMEGGSSDEATWEDADLLKLNFPDFLLSA